MNAGVKGFGIMAAVLLALLIYALPPFVHAEGSVANPQCMPWNIMCPCGAGINPGPQPPKCTTGGPNRANCPPGVCKDFTSGSETDGICPIAGVCRAVKFGEGAGNKGGSAGLDQVMKALGDLFGKLMQSGQQSSNNQTPPPITPTTGPTGCTQYFQTSDISQLSNPCAQYSPPTSNSLNFGTGNTGTSNDLISSLLNGTGNAGTSNNLVDQLLNGNDNGGTSTGVIIDNSFGTGFNTGSSSTIGSGFHTGTDTGSNGGLDSGSSSDNNVVIIGSGFGTTSVKDTNDSNAGGTTLTTIIKRPGTTSTDSSPVFFSGEITESASNSQLPRIIFATTTQTIAGLFALIPNGARGDIQVTGNSATFLVGNRDAAANTEVAGFYGSQTTVGQAPQGLIGQWCQKRPWVGNFLSKILPPSFFDGLCNWRGYQVGTPAPVTTAPVKPIVTLTQNPPVTVKPVVKPATTTPTTTMPVVPAVPVRVDIWAVPAQVSLGSRTQIFWNTKGVTNCTETSPDGSFSQSSLSGGAATVPITAPTTFTISCIAPDGSHATGYVTVRLAI